MTYKVAFQAATEQELLRELRRLVGENYVGDPYAAQPTGQREALTGLAAAFGRAQQALGRAWADSTLSFAPGPSPATATGTLTRTNTGAKLVLDVGSIFTTEEGRRYSLDSAVTWLSGDGTAKTATVTSVGEDYQQNTYAGAIAFLTEPVIGAGTEDGYDVTALALFMSFGAATGGSPDAVGLVAAGRGVYRALGEDTESLRARARKVSDVVSPKALLATARAVLAPYGVASGDVRYYEGINVGPGADDDCSDDPSTDIRRYTPGGGPGWFYITSPDFADTDAGCYSDDGASDYDCSDGYAPRLVAAHEGLVHSIQQAKGGGTTFLAVRST